MYFFTSCDVERTSDHFIAWQEVRFSSRFISREPVFLLTFNPYGNHPNAKFLPKLKKILISQKSVYDKEQRMCSYTKEKMTTKIHKNEARAMTVWGSRYQTLSKTWVWSSRKEGVREEERKEQRKEGRTKKSYQNKKKQKLKDTNVNKVDSFK